MLINLFTAFAYSKKPPTAKTVKTEKKKKNQTASAPSDLPWVLKLCMQEHTWRAGKTLLYHALLISTPPDMKCQYIPIFSQGRESWC
jgi:hypothetical protein